MDFEKIWAVIGTVAGAALIALVLLSAYLGAFSSGRVDYCALDNVPHGPSVMVLQHRSFSHNWSIVLPSYEAAVDYASRVCPNFHR